MTTDFAGEDVAMRINEHTVAETAEAPIFSGLVAVVQYRRKDDGIAWHTIAAFDQRGVAERYADNCGKGDMPWEYRVVDVPEAQP